MEAKEEYVPYGMQWKDELMKLSKIEIIALYRHACLSLQEPCCRIVMLDKNPECLPKKDGQYFVCRSGFKSVLEFKKGKSEMMWLKEIRWYVDTNN